jgi:hypothetical protein
VVRNTAKEPGRRRGSPTGRAGKESPEASGPAVSAGGEDKRGDDGGQARRNGGWREIEALREKAALKASLADVWDEDFDLDDEILAELDHTAEFFTTQEDPEVEVFEDDDDEEVDEYFDDDEV